MLIHAFLGLQMFLTLNLAPINEVAIDKSMSSAIIHNESQNPGQGDLSDMIQRYTAYNLWANQQMAEWLRSASEEAINQEIESSFSSIKETIFHIWNAEYLWLQTVKKEATDNSPVKTFDGGKDELMEGWLEASENFTNYVSSMSLSDLQDQRPRSRGDGYTVVADMIHHCMNHSTYHRGQLITMGRQAGLTDAPRTDFIYYISLPGN